MEEPGGSGARTSTLFAAGAGSRLGRRKWRAQFVTVNNEPESPFNQPNHDRDGGWRLCRAAWLRV